ncbi:DUF4145 domain-containing protein [Williamwhitmania taraxaci]|uniref:DUF4145 domain-containing protein n=1 Tax=Williamwhitmania taraxaci TaxID=1640674 RepID=A0A1G6NBF1_9BACT|nr:DUF4145 domain-containing protein [Williamwhitmania taraxaci]SDC65143.1 protein of unknown function [Williamwhitmania taraxaci]
MKYFPPIFKQQQFNCPLCGVYAKQTWSSLTYSHLGVGKNSEDMVVSYCHHCDGNSYWYKGNMIIPSSGNVELPNPDMPEDCKQDYLEARDILNLSPRGAAALLRLCIQKLMKHLGQNGENINNDIKELVKLGLPNLIQQSLDICRVVGNNAVHPGELELNDTPEIAQTMFRLINVIVEDRITKPKEIQYLFDSLPEGSKEAIKKRDK